jgi:hypothetical protein
MSKRISDVERVTGYFQTADEGEAKVVLLAVKGILGSRFPKAKVKKRATRLKAVPSTAENVA